LALECVDNPQLLPVSISIVKLVPQTIAELQTRGVARAA
jgi:hypothetical protein